MSSALVQDHCVMRLPRDSRNEESIVAPFVPFALTSAFVAIAMMVVSLGEPLSAVRVAVELALLAPAVLIFVRYRLLRRR